MFQAGYADALLGRVMQSVREAGIWDDAVIVVAADHGSGFTAGAPRRLVDDENLGEIAPMPLFIKAPGQDAGRVDDRPMRTIDVVPTIAHLLGVEIPYEVDGEPARQVERGDSETLTILPGEGTEPLNFARDDALSGLDRAAVRVQELFGEGWEGVWEMGPHSELIGQEVDALGEVRTSVGDSAALIRGDELGEVDPEATFVPSLIVAKLDGVSPNAPLAVAVNGRIAAVTRAYESVDGGVRTTGLVPPESFDAGANDVQIYAVVGRGDRLALESLGGTSP
jgi:hypothetical protein